MGGRPYSYFAIALFDVFLWYALPHILHEFRWNQTNLLSLIGLLVLTGPWALQLGGAVKASLAMRALTRGTHRDV